MYLSNCDYIPSFVGMYNLRLLDCSDLDAGTSFLGCAMLQLLRLFVVLYWHSGVHNIQTVSRRPTIDAIG